MQLTDKKIKKILKEYKDVFDILIRYDETREWPIGRERIDITLDKRVIQRLKDMRDKTGKPVSQIIEEAVEKI